MKATRPLATLLAVGAVLLAAACGSDDGSSSSSGSGGGDKGKVSISGQSFPEATLVASMYEQLLDAQGYDA
ncbi:MAG: hypothetical protein KC457_32690, partial [Myxococcales bacterium]|nr:hypothetical protein [Myxococcales bacterium]